MRTAHPAQPNVVQRAIQHAAAIRPVAAVFRHTFHHVDRWLLGPLGGRTLSSVLAGVPNILLTTTGARTGQARTVPLIGLIREDGATAVVGTRWGSQHEPAWAINLRHDRAPCSNTTATASTSPPIRYRPDPTTTT